MVFAKNVLVHESPKIAITDEVILFSAACSTHCFALETQHKCEVIDAKQNCEEGSKDSIFFVPVVSNAVQYRQKPIA